MQAKAAALPTAAEETDEDHLVRAEAKAMLSKL